MAFFQSADVVRVHITRTPPAKRMDGFDVAGFQVGKTYDVDPAIGVYLVVAGYATVDIPPDTPAPRDTKQPRDSK